MATTQINLLSLSGDPTLPDWQCLPSYTPVLGQTACQFQPSIFVDVILNVLKNPNITSSHLFRSDFLYDSHGGGNTETYPGEEGQAKLREQDAFTPDMPSGFRKTRTLIRQLVPRNPQLDKPLQQTCHIFEKGDEHERDHSVVVQCLPHVKCAEEVPWYHPCVQGLLYVYSWSKISKIKDNIQCQGQITPQSSEGSGRLSVQYRLFSENDLPLPKRLERTAFHLLSTIHKHGLGRLQGYTKKFHHDLLVPQSRVQNTYSALKQRHAKRLCDSWVEVTEPSKHVFEDLAIGAFLIEFWRDMYKDPATIDAHLPDPPPGNANLPEFPGFVDIGCGNGVLTEVLLCCGYDGWGFDARRRKTWAILSAETKERLEEKILIPQPLLSKEAVSLPTRTRVKPNSQDRSPVFSQLKSVMSSIFPAVPGKARQPDAVPRAINDQDKWHNGLFPRGTFIVSNHADELTAWTPLLASLSESPFLAIPCCSHNLAGTRFRAPSLYTNFTADAAAPNYFAKEKKQAGKTKHIAIHIPLTADMEDDDGQDRTQGQAETGDLKQLSAANRAKQPSAYASLCNWVAALADEVGFDVEKENLRIPSTRNMAVIGRRLQDGSLLNDASMADVTINPDAWTKVMQIIAREQPDSQAWVERARKLMAGQDDPRVNHG